MVDVACLAPGFTGPNQIEDLVMRNLVYAALRNMHFAFKLYKSIGILPNLLTLRVDRAQI